MIDSTLIPSQITKYKQPWLSSAGWDALFIISPAFVSSILVLLFAPIIPNSSHMPLWAWVSFILLIDVAHVYATLFRTYFDPQAFAKNRALLLSIPAACWLAGSLLYSIDDLLFWRVLAYTAVFHFVRQQYGFTVLYGRKEPPSFSKYKFLDHLMIYAATVYPLLFWHTHLPRNFNWFVDGDFIETLPSAAAQLGALVYAVIALAYLIKEAWLTRETGSLNLPKNLLILGTALSWWVGIVVFNSDLSFTITNVVSHGIPYIGLIWLYHHKNPDNQQKDRAESTPVGSRLIRLALSLAPVFLFMLAVFAYIEEGLWDGFIWREHLSIFPQFAALPAITDPTILAVLVPFLALPQSTHYVLDGFIWRVKDRTSFWSA